DNASRDQSHSFDSLDEILEKNKDPMDKDLIDVSKILTEQFVPVLILEHLPTTPYIFQDLGDTSSNRTRMFDS
ncbi:hypothetical protein S245_064439, partial [Arachis hypogaea]